MRQNLAFALALTAAVSLSGCRQFVPTVERGFDRVERFATGQPAGTPSNPGSSTYASAPTGSHETLNTASVRPSQPFADADPFLASPVSAPPVRPASTDSPADFESLTVLSVPGSHVTARPRTGTAGRETVKSTYNVVQGERTTGSDGGWQPTRHAN